jgi:hypothetical protein
MKTGLAIVLLWELESHFRDDPSALFEVPRSPKWHKEMDWHTKLDALVDRQDRDVLDSGVPHELAQAALARSRKQYCLEGKYLHSTADAPLRHDPAHEVLSALQVYERYGGAALEQVLEKTRAEVR